MKLNQYHLSAWIASPSLRCNVETLYKEERWSKAITSTFASVQRLVSAYKKAFPGVNHENALQKKISSIKSNQSNTMIYALKS